MHDKKIQRQDTSAGYGFTGKPCLWRMQLTGNQTLGEPV
jgi:hypothetical protein